MTLPEQRDGWAVVEEVIEAVADQRDVDPVDLPPLFDTIDTDALASVLATGDDSLTVTFRYAGLTVAVTSGDDVTVSEPGDDPEVILS